MNVLVLYHCRTNTGYAIASLERAFHESLARVFGDQAIYYAYTSLEGGMPSHVTLDNDRIFEIDYHSITETQQEVFSHWMRERNIQFVLGFDLGLHAPILRVLRDAGATVVVSYWGASISGIYPWYLLPLRRVQYLLARSRPDHFIFESEGMRRTATAGAAIPSAKTSVCYLGVDTERFQPQPDDSYYAHESFGIPGDRKIIMFSGHMEPRKGVHVLIDAFSRLVRDDRRLDLQLLLVGNSDADATRLLSNVTDADARERITFGGYRTDVPRLHHGTCIAVIASCGWDSFTMSSIEFASSGVPLIVSDLPGLREAVDPEETGLIVRAGDADHLRTAMARLANDPALRERMGAAARSRAVALFSKERQIEHLAEIFSRAASPYRSQRRVSDS